MRYFQITKCTFSFFLLAALILVCATELNAQKSIKELSELPDKKLMKMITTKPSGVSVAVNARQLTWEVLPPKIKKVGLLSFFIYTSGNESAGYYSSLTEKGGNALASMIHDKVLPTLSDQFSSKGMMVQTPDEYVTSDNRDIYENSKIELSGAMKFVQGFQNRFEKGETDNESAVADGYTLYTASLMGEDIKQSRGVGKLAKALNLDATLTIHFETDLSGKSVELEGITMAMHGPNPQPFDPDKEYKGISKGLRGYWEGIHYGSVSITLPKAVVIANYSKKEISNLNIDGLENVLNIMNNQLIETANSGFKKTSKAARPSR